MADPIIPFLIEKLSSFLQEEASLLTGVRNEAEDMKLELERMNAFLIDEGERSESTEQLKLWVNQVREVAYDTEDVLDKFMIHLARDDHENGLNSCLRAICFSFKSLKARHEIAMEIQRLKSQVANISEGHRRYPNLVEQSTTTSNWRRIELLPTHADLVVGIDEPKQQLVDWVVGGGSTDARLKCISVVGIGGCGKTTLVQQVYKDAVVKQHFDCHLWLVVSETPNIGELLVKIIQKLFAEIDQPAPHGMNSMDQSSLIDMIADFLEKRRYVIVIDDVWNVKDWEALEIALPENNCGSRVMLTTRKNEIALRSLVYRNGHTYTLEPLSKDVALALFSKRVFQDPCPPPQLEDICQSIVERCKGLPLAIVTIAGVLCTKDPNNIEQWEMFRKCLPSEFEENERIKRLLSLSYDELPYYLKLCYLYMYILPGDYEIERMMLIRLWIAEGFVQKRELMTVEEVAESYLYDLVNRSLVQVAKIDERGRLRMIHVHDVLRDVILSRAREQRMVTISSKGSTNSNSWLAKVRRLGVHDSEEICKVRSNNCFNSLRSLIIFKNASSMPLSTLVLILSSSKLLRVLNLTGVQLEEVPNEVFELLHLRYLCMRGTGVKSLSKNIGKLQNLETLDLKDTRITHLPNDILKLHNLRHLLAYTSDDFHHLPFKFIRGCMFPFGIRGMLSLQKLSFVDASNDVIVKELGNLTQLRRLGITKLRREDGNALCCSIAKLTNLRSLDIFSINENEILDVDSLSRAARLRFLQTLVLNGPLSKAPTWISSLQSLVKLVLFCSKLTDEPLNFLHDLPYLRYLQFNHAYAGEELQFKAGGFQKLKKLFLFSLKELRCVRIEEHSMPELEILNIGDCEFMEELPSGIQHLTKLQVFYLADMPVLTEQFLSKGREHQDYWKIAHVPRVACGYVKDGRREMSRL